jgi:hypothetical protein
MCSLVSLLLRLPEMLRLIADLRAFLLEATLDAPCQQGRTSTMWQSLGSAVYPPPALRGSCSGL